MHCPHRTILVLKLTLVLEIQVLLSRRGRHCSIAPTSGGSTVLRKGTQSFWPHGRRSLTLICQNSPCWLSCECCNNVCLPFGRHCSRSTERGCHVACALIGTNCSLRVRYGHGEATRGCNGYQECGCPSLIVKIFCWCIMALQWVWLSLVPRPTPFFLFFGFRWQ